MNVNSICRINIVVRQGEREWEEQRQREAEERRLVEEENSRMQALNEALSAWHTSQLIREYIEAVKGVEIIQSGAIDTARDLGKWITWASKHADKLDPRFTLPRFQ